MANSPKQAKTKHRMHPNSLKNLTPFKPGENGDKPGQGYSLRAELKHALKLRRKELVDSTIEGAIKREPTPFKEVWDRVDGKVPGDTPPVANVNVVFVIGRGYREPIEGGRDAIQTDKQ